MANDVFTSYKLIFKDTAKAEHVEKVWEDGRNGLMPEYCHYLYDFKRDGNVITCWTETGWHPYPEFIAGLLHDADMSDDDYTCDFVAIDEDDTDAAASSPKAAGGNLFVVLWYWTDDEDAVESVEGLGSLFDFSNAYEKSLAGDDDHDYYIVYLFTDSEDFLGKLAKTNKHGTHWTHGQARGVDCKRSALL